jgi:hypothetical protein
MKLNKTDKASKVIPFMKKANSRLKGVGYQIEITSRYRLAAANDNSHTLDLA